MKLPLPPFHPDEEPAARSPRLRDIPLKTLFPNFLTLLAICSGLTAIRFAIEDKLEWAIGAIILAALLDAIDGRIARFLKSTSHFGAQMDSLADFVNFGVAPGMILYFNLLEQVRPFGWIAALIYAICACLRLARFNVELDGPDKPSWQADFFVGVPAPAGAMVVLLPCYLWLLGVPVQAFSGWIVAGYAMAVGLLMVSNLPTYSGKNIGQAIPSRFALPMILGSVLLTAILLSYPWATLAVAACLYLVSLPWARSYYHRLEAQHQAKARQSSRQAAPRRKKPKSSEQ